MTSIRAFIAIELPLEIHSQLENVVKRLKAARAVSVRWVASGNIHLTLKFLGDTEPANLKQLSVLLSEVASRYNPMTLVINGLGAFPNNKRPRVIWIGVEIPTQMKDLHWDIEGAAERIGCPPEGRDFSPHLTLGRVQKNATRENTENISAALAAITVGELGRFQSTGFTLFRSDLRPSGSIYTPLEYFQFTQ
jgi:2'-5' RNA ligase